MRLCAAIEFCATRNIPFEIAGMPENSSTTKRLKRRYTLRPDVFAPGAINTREFLKKNADRYLFVAGVGQVLLEAGAAGFPCLLASDKGAEYSTFLTRHNVRENYDRNLTLAHPAERHTNVRVSDIEFWQLDDYDISDAIRRISPFPSVLRSNSTISISSSPRLRPQWQVLPACLDSVSYIFTENTSISCLCVRCAEIMRFYKNAPIS